MTSGYSTGNFSFNVIITMCLRYGI